MKILTLGIIAGLTAASTVEATDHKQSAVTIVDSETDADATHVYLSQDDSTDSGMTKMRSFKPVVTTYNGTACWGTKVVYRAKNRFGALRITSTFVYLTGGDKPKVLGINANTSLDQD